MATTSNSSGATPATRIVDSSEYCSTAAINSTVAIRAVVDSSTGYRSTGQVSHSVTAGAPTTAR